MTNHDGGKGDAPRPLGVDQETFDKNWDAIFKNGIPTLAELEEQRKIKYELEADNDHIEILATIPFGR
jgi:hypothetical protein